RNQFLFARPETQGRVRGTLPRCARELSQKRQSGHYCSSSIISNLIPISRRFEKHVYYRDVRFPALLHACAFALVLSGCYGNSKPSSINTPAPDFMIQDPDRSVTLSQLRGKIVVLNFWATWCPPCIEEMPSLVQMQKKMQDKGVTVLAVS